MEVVKIPREIENKAIVAFNKRKTKKILWIRHKTLENRLFQIVYVLFLIFSVLCAYVLGLSHSAL